MPVRCPRRAGRNPDGGFVRAGPGYARSMSALIGIVIAIVVVAGLVTAWRLVGPNFREFRPWRQTRRGRDEPEVGDPPPPRP